MLDINIKVDDFITLVVTHRCNGKCKFCIDEYRYRNEDMTMDIVDKGLDFAESRGVKNIALLGGEAILHPNIIEIAKRVKKRGFNCILTTNYSIPSIVKKLDGIVDSFNISYYEQTQLPHKDDFVSDLTLSTLIYDERFKTQKDLDDFIDKYSQSFDSLKFSTLSVANDWCKEHQKVSFLDELPNKTDILLFGEQLGHLYRGYPIERFDVLLIDGADDSYKVFPDGEISNSWHRDIEEYAYYCEIKGKNFNNLEVLKDVQTKLKKYSKTACSPILKESLILEWLRLNNINNKIKYNDNQKTKEKEEL